MSNNFPRSFIAPNTSFFLFGPRGTGKSTWLFEHLGDALFINLLKNSDFLRLLRNPSLIREEILARPKGWIVIDEIQKIPGLLDEVHQIIFEFKDKYKFALTGSSARKLKRENANMLAGRARYREFFPLTSKELNFNFEISDIIKYGTLPTVVTTSGKADKIDYLQSYVNTYLKEEIAQEALTRNLDSFVRFLEVAAIVNGQVMNISNVARDVGVARSTVDAYFSILVDTLVCTRLPGYRLKAKVKEVVHSKLFFFDCGIARAMNGKLREDPDSFERGFLFETFILNELRAFNSYSQTNGSLYYWGTPNHNEVDFVYKNGSKYTGIEVKTTQEWKTNDSSGLKTLLESGKISKAYGVYWGKRTLLKDDITILPVKEFCQRLWSEDLL